MRRIILLGMAYLLCLGANVYGQDTAVDDEFSFSDDWLTDSLMTNEEDDDVEDFYSTIPAEMLVPTLNEIEQDEVNEILMSNAKSVLYDDGCGHIIYRQADSRYGYVNIRMHKLPMLTDLDSILFIDFNEKEMGILAKSGEELAVYTYEGVLLIPPVKADEVIKVVKNPYKCGNGRNFGYAIIKSEDRLYAVDTNGKRHLLDMDKVLMENNLIFGYKGDDIAIYTTDGSEKEEVIITALDKDVEFEEVEILSTAGHARYSYIDTKYNDITPGVVIKKKNQYWLYPGEEKLHVKKLEKGELLGLGVNKKVFFPNRLYAADELRQDLDKKGY